MTKQNVEVVYEGALTNAELAQRVEKALKAYGYGTSTLFASSLCCDEVNRELEYEFSKLYGDNFSMGGLAGFAFGGVTSFGAMAHHIPNDGSCLVIYGPHVGIDSNGEVGKIDRRGRSNAGACCGSAAAAAEYVKKVRSNKIKPSLDTEIEDLTNAQQGWVGKSLLPYGERLETAKNPAVELPLALFDAQDELMKEIVDTGCEEVAGNGLIALLGGIQINTPGAEPDYFLPKVFQLRNNEGDLVEDLLYKLEILPTHRRKSIVKLAVACKVIVLRVYAVLSWIVICFISQSSIIKFDPLLESSRDIFLPSLVGMSSREVKLANSSIFNEPKLVEDFQELKNKTETANYTFGVKNSTNVYFESTANGNSTYDGSHEFSDLMNFGDDFFVKSVGMFELHNEKSSYDETLSVNDVEEVQVNNVKISKRTSMENNADKVKDLIVSIYEADATGDDNNVSIEVKFVEQELHEEIDLDENEYVTYGNTVKEAVKSILPLTQSVEVVASHTSVEVELNTEKFQDFDQGYCITTAGKDQNSGVVKLAKGDFGADSKSSRACLDLCSAHAVSNNIEATACETIHGQWNRGCYLHTKEVLKGNGKPRHQCAPLRQNGEKKEVKTELGYCVSKMGYDQNIGVIKLFSADAGEDLELFQSKCLNSCQVAALVRSDATGCEASWGKLINNGCFLHTNVIERGNGEDKYSCWVFE